MRTICVNNQEAAAFSSGKDKRRHERLFEIADGQAGYFTAAQAREAGYDYRLQHYHRRAGNWIVRDRGLFRLRLYPAGRDEQLAALSLWSHNRRGEVQAVLSHQSALAIHGLSDAMPEKVHLSVPAGFRKEAPEVVRLHKTTASNPLLPDEIERSFERRSGFLVTTPERAIRDVGNDPAGSVEDLQNAIFDRLDRLGEEGLPPAKVQRLQEAVFGISEAYSARVAREALSEALRDQAGEIPELLAQR